MIEKTVQKPEFERGYSSQTKTSTQQQEGQKQNNQGNQTSKQGAGGSSDQSGEKK